MSNLSFVRHVGDGVKTQFTLAVAGENIGYFRTSDIHAYVDDVEVSITINVASPHIVIITPAPALDADVLLRREVPISQPYANFERGNNFGHRQVNNTFLQQLYLAQEGLDGFKPVGYYAKQDYNMGAKRVVNLATPVDKTDAVTKQITDDIGLRVDSLENNFNGSEGTILPYQYESVGGETTLDIPHTITSILSVHINGILQKRSTSSTDGAWELDNGKINIAEPLESGDEVVAYITGIL